MTSSDCKYDQSDDLTRVSHNFYKAQPTGIGHFRVCLSVSNIIGYGIWTCHIYMELLACVVRTPGLNTL